MKTSKSSAWAHLKASWIVAACTFILATNQTARGEESPSPLAQDFQSFWEAPGPKPRLEQVEKLLKHDASFDELLSLLAAGPRFRDDVPRGRILRSRKGAGNQEHPWLLLVPEDYRPDRSYFLRVDLHGGMGAPPWPKDGSWAKGWNPQSKQLILFPAGWWDSMWWTAGQVENLDAILDEVKRTWNVDENRVLLVGSSDGCIGSCFYALRHSTAFAGFGGFIGCPVRLTNPTLRIDGQMHLSNLDGTRFFLANGGRDHLFPVKDIRDYWDLFQRHGADVEYIEYPREGHGFSLTREDERKFARFLFNTRRDPLPDKISWATERTDRYQRRGWIEIVELGKASSDSKELEKDIVMPRICTGKYRRLRAPRPRPWGRVDASRSENRVTVVTRGVRRFRILLAPGEFDLSKEVEIIVNGIPVLKKMINPDPRILLTRAAHDLDRTMLFAAEEEIQVP